MNRPQIAGKHSHALKIVNTHPAAPDINEDLASEFTERAYIAALFRDPDGKKLIAEGITEDHFTSKECANAFLAATLLIADGVQPNAATIAALVDSATMIEVETSLKENASAASRAHYVTVLKDYRLKRQTAALNSQIAAAASAGHPPAVITALVEQIEALQHGETQPATQSRFIWADEFCALPPTEIWSIKDYLEPDTLCVMYGDSEAYKSFLAVDMACHIAIGKAWRGKKVKQGIALYIAGEGGNGLRKRIKAWFDYHGEPIRNIAVSTVSLDLCNSGNVDALIADTEALLASLSVKPTFIIMDTLNTHFGEGDENSTADMTRFLARLRTLRIATGATILIPHHCGHGAKDRGRGSISLRNGIDWEYRLERSPESRTTTLTCTKCKDHEKPDPLSWNLETVSLPWADEDGKPLNSAVLVPNDSVPVTKQVKEKSLTGMPKQALSILQELYQEQRRTLVKGGQDPQQARVTISQWNDAMQAISENKSYRSRIRSDLEERGYIRFTAPYVYLMPDFI